MRPDDARAGADPTPETSPGQAAQRHLFRLGAGVGVNGPVLRTSRLTLRPFSVEDADELLALFRDPGVRRWLLDDTLVSAEWMREEIHESDARFRGSGLGLWSIVAEGRPAIVGFAGFRPFFDPPEMQLLYGLLPACWGAGLATEAARALCDHAFHVLAVTEIRAATDRPNVASIRVLERLGMSLEKTTDDGPDGTAFFTLHPAGSAR